MCSADNWDAGSLASGGGSGGSGGSSGGGTPPGSNIVYDNVSSAQATNTSGLTWSHTVGSGSNRYLIVGVSYWASAFPVSSITYNGTNLTYLGGTNNNVDGAELWGLANPASGTHNIVVTMSAGGMEIGAGATSWTNVNQTTPTGTVVTAQSTSGNASLTINGTTGDLIVDVLAHEDGNTAVVNGAQTEQWNFFAPGQTTGAMSSRAASNSNSTMSWTLTGGGTGWAQVAVMIHQFASQGGGGGGGSP
jgi:hypothetical protein